MNSKKVKIGEPIPLSRYGVTSLYYGRCCWVLIFDQVLVTPMDFDWWWTPCGCGSDKVGARDHDVIPPWERLMLFLLHGREPLMCSYLVGTLVYYFSSLRGALDSTGAMMRLRAQLMGQLKMNHMMRSSHKWCTHLPIHISCMFFFFF